MTACFLIENNDPVSAICVAPRAGEPPLLLIPPSQSAFVPVGWHMWLEREDDALALVAWAGVGEVKNGAVTIFMWDRPPKSVDKGN